MKKIIMILCFILIALTSMVSVCAIDIDNHSMETNSTESVLLDESAYMTSDNTYDNSSQNNVIEIENNLPLNLSNDNNEDNLINHSEKNNSNIKGFRMISPIVKIDQPLRSADLNGLQKFIDEVPKGLTLDLNENMKNNGKENKIVNINKDITIDGHGNTIDFGGHENCYIEITAKNVILKNIKFINGFNDKSDNGGALYIHKNTMVTLVNCSFSDNFARKSGGAVYSDSTLKILNCNFHNNVAKKENGGAVYGYNVNIYSSTFDGNKADDNGGAVYAKNYININKNQNANQGITCYFTNNCAGDDGGALYCNGEVLVKNTLLNNNFAGSNDDGGAIWAKMNIIINNSSYNKNFCGESSCDQVYSEKGKIILDGTSVKTAGNYDNLKNVSLSKDVVNFYLKNSDDMENLFNFINKHNPSWNIINITLAPSTVFKVNYNTFDTKFQKFALRLTGNMVINGNPGSTIKGKINSGGGKKNIFMYLTPNSKLALVDVSLENFDQVFMNMGTIYCHDVAFVKNKAYMPYGDKKSGFQSFKDSLLWSGAVVHNCGNVYFDKCTFYANYAESFYGDVLYAEKNALTVFDSCTFKDCDDTFIIAKEKSTTIIYQDHNLNDDLKDCYFEPDASLSVISNKKHNGTCIFNCSNADELQKVLYTINSLTPNAPNIVINLTPGTYNIKSEWLSKKNYMRSMNWRSECHKPTIFGWGEYRTKSGITQYNYALDVGFIPVTINGNGATIKITGGDNDNRDGFAYIGCGGILNIVNITFTKFNGVFESYGTLNAINCIFTDNVADDYWSNGGSVVFGSGSSNNFINCTFNKNTNSKSHSDIMNLKDSSIRFDGCNFDNFFKNRKIIGKISDNSVINAPLCLKDKIDFDKSSAFHNNDKIIRNNATINRGSIMLVQVNNNSNLTNNTKIFSICDEVDPLNLVLNINKDGEIDLSKLGFKNNLIINGNGHKIKFNHQEEIKKSQSITLINITFSDYSHILFKNKGSCTFIFCNLTGNTGKYLVDNDEGGCTFINCTITKNKNKKYLFNNDEGSLSFINCTINGNDGKIYNEKGRLFFFNSNLDPKTLIHNYQTANCEIISCTGGDNTKFEEQGGLAGWKQALIIGGISIAVAVISYGVGIGCFNIGLALGHEICGIVAAGISGVVIGAAGGYVTDAIIAHYTHDHSLRYTLMGGMAVLGMIAGLAGAIITDYHTEYVDLIGEYDHEPVNFENLRGQPYEDFYADRILEGEFYIDNLDISNFPEHIINANPERFVGPFTSYYNIQPQQIISFTI